MSATTVPVTDNGAWEEAQTIVCCHPGGAPRVYLAIAADQASHAVSQQTLDRTELVLLQQLVTTGSFSRRMQVWRYVGYRLAGITPGHLRGAS